MSADPLDAEPLRLLVGPTASGKSDLAPDLAAALGAEIVSLDSMLVYRGMDIGTAKPGPELRARTPHHLIDCVGSEETYSVSRYVDDARTALDVVAGRQRRALFVGGTALYLKALTHGLFRGPDVDPSVRAAWEARWLEDGGEACFAELARVDPASAARLHPNDRKRVLRALEVHAQSGRSLSEWQREWRDGDQRRAGRHRRIVGLEVDVGDLDRRIPLRTRSLLDRGWVEEARAIRDGTGFSKTSAQALGYAQVLELADGKLDRANAELEINLRTRQFARRQRTWFRQFPEILWIRSGDPGAIERARAHLDL